MCKNDNNNNNNKNYTGAKSTIGLRRRKEVAAGVCESSATMRLIIDTTAHDQRLGHEILLRKKQNPVKRTTKEKKKTNQRTDELRNAATGMVMKGEGGGGLYS